MLVARPGKEAIVTQHTFREPVATDVVEKPLAAYSRAGRPPKDRWIPARACLDEQGRIQTTARGAMLTALYCSKKPCDKYGARLREVPRAIRTLQDATRLADRPWTDDSEDDPGSETCSSTEDH